LVTWFDADEYCNWLSTKRGLTPAHTIVGDDVTCDFMADGYRLPTEAEWELAAKGGKSLESLLPEDRDKYDLPPFPGPVEFLTSAEDAGSGGKDISAKEQGKRRAKEIRAAAEKVGWFMGNSRKNVTNPVKGK
jgi:formylglycine-generating enzyme required for sulfatase activity